MRSASLYVCLYACLSVCVSTRITHDGTNGSESKTTRMLRLVCQVAVPGVKSAASDCNLKLVSRRQSTSVDISKNREFSVLNFDIKGRRPAFIGDRRPIRYDKAD